MVKYNLIMNPMLATGAGLILTQNGVTKNYIFTSNASQTYQGTTYTGAALRDQYYNVLMPQQQSQTVVDIAIPMWSSAKVIDAALTEDYLDTAVLDAASTIGANVIAPPTGMLPYVAFPPYPLVPFMSVPTSIPTFPTL